MIGDEGWGDQLYLSLCKISTRGDQDPHRPGQVPPSSHTATGSEHLGERLQPPAPSPDSHLPARAPCQLLSSTYCALAPLQVRGTGEEERPPARQSRHRPRGALGSEWGLWAPQASAARDPDLRGQNPHADSSPVTPAPVKSRAPSRAVAVPCAWQEASSRGEAAHAIGRRK